MSAFAFEVVQVGLQAFVTVQFSVGAASQVSLLSHLQVKSSGKLSLLILESCLFVTSAQQVGMSTVVRFSRATKVKLTQVSSFREFAGSLLCFVQVVVQSFDAVVVVGVFTLLAAVEVAQAVDFFLVSTALFFEFVQLERKIVDVFAESIAAVTLCLYVALGSEDLSFFAGNLLASGSNLALHVVVVAVLFIEEEASVIDFLFETVELNEVLVVTLLEIVVLEKFLVLQVAVLGLNSVQLVAESKVVLVALLDFKNLGLELRN